MVKYYQPFFIPRRYLVCQWFWNGLYSNHLGKWYYMFLWRHLKSEIYLFLMSYILIVLQSYLTHEAAMFPSDEIDLNSHEHRVSQHRGSKLWLCHGQQNRLSVIRFGIKRKSWYITKWMLRDYVEDTHCVESWLRVEIEDEPLLILFCCK